MRDPGRHAARLAALALTGLFLTALAAAAQPPPAPHPRAREAGIRIGALEPGPLDAITDVGGVRVGHVTLRSGASMRTGVTAILPHGGNLYRQKVPAAIEVLNGFGKLTGLSQVRELGEIETPIVLTATLSVWRASDAVVTWTLAQRGNEDVASVNPVVAETNDAALSDIRARPIAAQHVLDAIAQARGGPVPEGAVGAGTGTVALGWKGGIGTASRRVAGMTVGALVQSNFGGRLTVAGVPVWRELGPPPPAERGSVVIVLATDAALDARQLGRLARRAGLGLARTGAAMSHGSGDYVIAFSVERAKPALVDDALSPLFDAAAESTEEAILNSLFRATSTTGFRGRRVEALPVVRVLEILRKHGALGP